MSRRDCPNTQQGTHGSPPGGELPGRNSTEADIARLEREDLTDLTVIAKLREAYRQDDPNEEEFFPGFRRSATDFMFGTEEDFERWIAEAEAVLQSNPPDYMTRAKRLYAMAGREMMRTRGELRARNPEVVDSALCRMPGPNESEGEEEGPAA